jgi:hypothetical protein
MLTRQKGSVASVVATANDTGWVVGWIDDRSGTPQPYLALLTERLARKLPDKRIGGDARTTGFAVTPVGDEVWHVRSEGAAGAPAALKLARLNGRNLSVLSELVLTSDGANYHSPSFVVGAAQPTVAAVREDTKGATVVLYALPADASAAPAPLVLAAQHAVVAFSASCQGERCHLVATTESDQTQQVEAFAFGATAVTASAEVASLVATSSLEIAPELRRNEASLYDLSTRGEPRISRLRLDW